MIIKNLNIEKFGKFNNEVFSFREGLNVVYGKNESGKTTLADFIAYMLYGSDRRTKSDMAKYTPRDSSNMRGSMEYLKDGERFILERGCKSLLDYSLKNLDTGDVVKLDTTPGASLFGYGCEAFYKTFYSGSVSAVICDDKNGSISDKLSRISGTSEGEVTYTQIKKNLLTKINTYTSKRCQNPIIPTLEASIYPAQKQMEIKKQKLDDVREKKKKLPLMNAQLKELEKIVQREEEKREYFKKLKLNNEYMSLSEEINRLEDILNSDRLNVFSKLCDEDLTLMDKGGADIIEKSRLSFAKYDTAYKITLCLALLFFVLTATFTGTYFASATSFMFLPVWLILTLGFSVTSYVTKKLSKASKNRYENVTHKIAQLLAKCEIDDSSEFLRLYNKWHEDLCPGEDEYKEKLLKLRNKFDLLVNNIKTSYDLSEIIHLDKNQNSYDNIDIDDYDENTVKSAYNQIEQIKMEIRDILMISEEDCYNHYERSLKDVQNLKSQLENANRELEIYKKALSMLEIANTELSRVFAPRVSAFASGIFSRLTMGRYDTINVNNKLNISVKDNMHFFDDENFSTGAKEQMYLALRLSIAHFSSEEKLPVFLDDSFSYYDDERKTSAFEFLKEFSADRQVVYLTCHKSDLKTANALGANVIMLSD